MGRWNGGRLAKRLVMGMALLLVLLLYSAPPAASAAASSDPQVTQFTPQGTVKKVRQVSARFSEPMVPLRSEEHTSELQSLS